MATGCKEQPSGPVRILALSDETDLSVYNTQVRERFGGVDLVLGCGDLEYDYLEFVVTMLGVPVLYVHGNHDRERVLREDGWHTQEGPGGCTSLEGRVVWCKGLLIGGLGGSMRYRPNAPFQYTERQMANRVLRLTPRLLWNRRRHGRALDILVTHAPPKDIHDEDNLCHTGFRAFRRFMDRHQPRYLIHGHVQPNGLDPRVSDVGGTRVINAFSHQVIEVPPWSADFVPAT
jgi:Icc-related predicted phosphoesterase